MTDTLESMTEGIPNYLSVFFIYTDERTDERQVRGEFNAEHGGHLPADLCLCVENPPTKWEILPRHGEAVEVLPDIDYDLLVEVSSCLSSIGKGC